MRKNKENKKLEKIRNNKYISIHISKINKSDTRQKIKTGP